MHSRQSKALAIGAALVLGLTMGAAVWLASARLAGRDEPWDADSAYYPLALSMGGLLGGLLFRRYWGFVVLGSFLGQAFILVGRALADPTGGGVGPLGLLFLGMYSILTVVGAGIGATLRGHLHWPPWRHRPGRAARPRRG